jgi:hypothetical protein
MTKLADHDRARLQFRVELLAVLLATVVLAGALALLAKSVWREAQAAAPSAVAVNRACRVSRAIDAVVSNVQDIVTRAGVRAGAVGDGWRARDRRFVRVVWLVWQLAGLACGPSGQ